MGPAPRREHDFRNLYEQEREAKEMIISKRTVCPEHLRTRSEATLLARGEGFGEGGNRSGFSYYSAVADFENRAPVEAGTLFSE